MYKTIYKISSDLLYRRSVASKCLTQTRYTIFTYFVIAWLSVKNPSSKVMIITIDCMPYNTKY